MKHAVRRQQSGELSILGQEKSMGGRFGNETPLKSWSMRYGEKHRFCRIQSFPAGFRAPNKVRLYQRSGHYLLQWWDPEARRNLAVRVDGDLLDALSRARAIDERLVNRRSSGVVAGRLRHGELVTLFLTDLQRRADAGEVALGTVRRYRAALQHYIEFSQAGCNASVLYASQVTREFAQRFSAFLMERQVTGNGRSGAPRRRMKSSRFVLDAARAMFEWAIDPDRGHLLQGDFRNPFRRALGSRRTAADMLGAPDITADMAAALLAAADDFQLPLFAALLFFGLRAMEPCFLLCSDVRDGWLHVDCKPEINVTTKGRRNKRFPLVGEVGELLAGQLRGRRRRMLFERREVREAHNPAQIADAQPEWLVAEFQRRLGAGGASSVNRSRARNQLFHDCGALNYDAIEAEFQSVARRLDWPTTATLKDLRHLFCTALANAGMPEGYRRFLMGHAPGREPIVAYTHLDKVREFYTRAIESELAQPLNVLRKRLQASGEER